MKICVLPGDGIGPEIMAEAVRVLHALDLKFEMEEALLGGCAFEITAHPFVVTGCGTRITTKLFTAVSTLKDKWFPAVETVFSTLRFIPLVLPARAG